MEVAACARLRNLVLGGAPRGFAWHDDTPPVDTDTLDGGGGGGDPSRLVLFVDMPTGGCITVDEVADISIPELQFTLNDLEERDSTFGDNHPRIAAKIAAARRSKNRWFPTRTLASYELRSEITVAHLLRLLKGEADAPPVEDASTKVSRASRPGTFSRPVKPRRTPTKSKRGRPDGPVACSLETAKDIIRDALKDHDEQPGGGLAAGAGSAAVVASRPRNPKRPPPQKKETPRVMDGPRLGAIAGLSAGSTLRDIENGLVSARARRSATRRLDAFFSRLRDQYECSWPHTKGAQYCNELFADRIDKHHVRHSIGGYRVAARDFDDGDPPAGTVETVYANAWGTIHGRHFHRKSRGRMATVTVTAVYDDALTLPIDHAGPIAGPDGWFQSAVKFAGGPRPGEHILEDPIAALGSGGGEVVKDAVHVVCFAGAKLSVEGKLPGYSQSSHLAPLVLLPRHSKFDDDAHFNINNYKNDDLVGTVHLEHKVTFRKHPVHLRLRCVHEGGGSLPTAVKAVACEVVPRDMPHLVDSVEQDLQAEIQGRDDHADINRQWWEDERGLFELPIPGRVPDGSLRLRARLEDGVALREDARPFEATEGDERFVMVRAARDIRGESGPVLAEMTIPIRRPAVRVLVRLEYADGTGVKVLVDDKGQHIPQDDFSNTTATSGSSLFHRLHAAARWRLAARLARRKFGFSSLQTSAEPRPDWVASAVTLPDEPPTPVEHTEDAGFIVTVRNPEASLLVPRDLLLGHLLNAPDSTNDEDGRHRVFLIEPQRRWPNKGWARSTALALRFRKLAAKFRLEVVDFCGIPAVDALDIARTSLNGTPVSDEVITDAGMELHIPAHTPFTRWTLDARLTDGVRLFKAAVKTADEPAAFSKVEAAIIKLRRMPKWQQLPSHIPIPLQAGELSAARLYVALPPVAVDVVPMNAVDGKELVDGTPGWLAKMLDISLADGTDERYGIEASVLEEDQRAKLQQQRAESAGGRVSLLVHRHACLRLLKSGLPAGFDLNDGDMEMPRRLVPIEQHWPAESWRWAPPLTVELRKRPAVLRLSLKNDVTDEPISDWLVGEVCVSGVKGECLLPPGDVKGIWSAADAVDIPVPGFDAKCDVNIHIRLADGTPLGGSSSDDPICLVAGEETSVTLRLPLETTAPRVIVAPWRVDAGGGDGEPLSRAAPGWLFDGAAFDPAPPLDTIPLAGGGVECRITRDVEVRLAEHARALLRNEILPGYDIVESDTFGGGVISLRCPVKNAYWQPEEKGDEETFALEEEEEAKAAASPTTISERFAALAGIRDVSGTGSFITIKVAKQPAEVVVRTIFAKNSNSNSNSSSSSSPAPLIGLSHLQVDGQPVELSIATSFKRSVLVPGRGTREKAPVSKTSVVAKRSRGWLVVDAEPSGKHGLDESLIVPLLITAGSVSTVTIAVDDSELWARVTKPWLSRKLASIFRRKLARLEVYVTWASRRRAPLVLIKALSLGGAFRKTEHDLLADAAGKKRGSATTRQRPGDEDKSGFDGARRRLLRRLSLRSQRSPAFVVSVAAYGERDERAVSIMPPRERSWTTTLRYELEGVETPPPGAVLAPNKTTALWIAVSDEPLWRRLSRRKLARRWRDTYQTRTLTVTAAVEALAANDEPSYCPLEGGEWLLDALEFRPNASFAAAFGGPGRPIRAHISEPTELSARLQRPGFALSGFQEDGREKLDLAVERANVRVLLRRQPATVRFEIVFRGGRAAPIETVKGIGLAPARARETTVAIARPAREWRDASHHRELSVLLADTGAPDAAPKATVRVVVAASRSWEIASLAEDEPQQQPEKNEEDSEDSEDPSLLFENFFSAQRRSDGVVSLCVTAGQTRVVRVGVCDARLYLGLCLRRFVRRILPNSSIRPLRWRWAQVDGSAGFEKLYTGRLRGDETDPRTRAARRGWTTRTREDGRVEYVYTDYTSARCAGNSWSATNNNDAQTRRVEWRRVIVERRRKKAARAQRCRERREEKTRPDQMDAVDLLRLDETAD